MSAVGDIIIGDAVNEQKEEVPKQTTSIVVLLPNKCIYYIHIYVYIIYIYVFFSQFQLFYCNPKTIAIMQNNYLLENSGSNGKPKRDANPANLTLPIRYETEIHGCHVKLKVAPIDNT